MVERQAVATRVQGAYFWPCRCSSKATETQKGHLVLSFMATCPHWKNSPNKLRVTVQQSQVNIDPTKSQQLTCIICIASWTSKNATLTQPCLHLTEDYRETPSEGAPLTLWPFTLPEHTIVMWCVTVESCDVPSISKCLAFKSLIEN